MISERSQSPTSARRALELVFGIIGKAVWRDHRADAGHGWHAGAAFGRCAAITGGAILRRYHAREGKRGAWMADIPPAMATDGSGLKSRWRC